MTSNKSVQTLVHDNAAFITSVIDGMNGQLADVATVQAAFDAAKGKLLPFLTLALQGADKVTEADWAKNWATPAMASYVASGRYKIDAPAEKNAAGDITKPLRSLSASSSVSALKVCVIALTHGLEPGAGDSLFSYTKEARKECKAKGWIKADSAATTTKKAERASNAPRSAASEKQASAMFIAAGKDKELAAKLQACAGTYRPQFEAWFDGLMSVVASLKAA